MKINISLFARFLFFLCTISIVLLLHTGVTTFQNTYIIKPISRSTENVQAMSRFLNTVEEAMSLMNSYRWDYGDKADFIWKLRSYLSQSEEFLEIYDPSSETSKEQRVLHDAVRLTFSSFLALSDKLISLLLDNRIDEAGALFYEELEVCGRYLREYAQQLLDHIISDNQSIFEQQLKMNQMMDKFIQILVFLSLILCILFFVTLFKLVRTIASMSHAAREISGGNFDIPDIRVDRQDEVGELATVFNAMKSSLKSHVELLEEKREMERVLFQTEKNALELQNHLEREKLAQLRSQINPHFLFNTLNVIKYKSHEEKAFETEALLSSLARLFRYALQSDETETLLSREIRICQEFYSLYKARFGEKIRLDWSFSSEVDLTMTIVPSFILQPLVENSFKHGLGAKEEEGSVMISIFTEDGYLWLTVQDDGVGMEEEKLQYIREHLYDESCSSEHIGLYNVASRLRLLSPECRFNIESRKGEGTRIEMRLPFIVQEEEEEDL